MPTWVWVVDSLALVLALLLLTAVWLVVRRRVLIRRSGAAFDMSVTRRGVDDGGWMLGFGIYKGPVLQWYRTFSVSLRPRYRFVRGDLTVGARRAPQGPEIHTLPSDHVVVPTENPHAVQQFAMSSGALTGLLSWLESSPPGERVNNVL